MTPISDMFVPSSTMKRHGESCAQYSVNNIRAGNLVKVCSYGERLWLLVTEVRGKRIKGIIFTRPILPLHGLRFGQPMHLDPSVILDVIRSSFEVSDLLALSLRVPSGAEMSL